jgi:hypothetical protein
VVRLWWWVVCWYGLGFGWLRVLLFFVIVLLSIRSVLIFDAFFEFEQTGHPEFPLVMTVLNKIFITELFNEGLIFQKFRYFKGFHFVFCRQIVQVLLVVMLYVALVWLVVHLF